MSKIPNTRHLWMPRLKEVASQCASCPFREGNDKEFSAVVGALLLTDRKKVTGRQIKIVRENVKKDLEARGSGDFICHNTVLDLNDPHGMKKPVSCFRQCSGATNFWRGE